MRDDYNENFKKGCSNPCRKNSLAIVIPTLGASDRLKSLLTSLTKMIESLENESISIHVVFNGNQSNVVESKFISAYYLSEKNVNCARNLGIFESNSTHVLFLDDDIEFIDIHYLNNIFELMNQYPNEVMGGHYVSPQAATPLDKAYLILAHEWILSGELACNNWHLLGGSLIVPRSIFKFHLFDEAISFGGSETEFLLRVQKNGITMKWKREMAVIHHPEMTAKKLHYKARRQAETMARFFPNQLSTSFQDLLINENSKSEIEKLAIENFLKFYRDTFEFFFRKAARSSDETSAYI